MRNRLYILGPVGLTVGPCPVGWWIVLSSGYQLRYDHVWWRIYRRVEKERYPLVLRDSLTADITGGELKRWRLRWSFWRREDG